MMAEIVRAIVDKLKKDGLDVKEYGFKDLIDRRINLQRPAVNVVINTAGHQKVTQYTYKTKANVSLIVLFQMLNQTPTGDALRREGVYKIIEGIEQSLLLQKLGLPLENGFYPEGFRNITTSALAAAMYQLYELRFWCAYNTTYNDDPTDDGTLTSILAQYYLQPRDYTGMQGVTGPEASDYIGLTGISNI